MEVLEYVKGICPGCNQEIYDTPDGNVTVDPDEKLWHRDCRNVWHRQNSQPKRGPGRPRKTEVEA